jgi:subtilisin family serine protease
VFYPAPAASVTPDAGVARGSNGLILGGRTVFPARVRLSQLERLSAVAGVLRVETAWTPRRVPPLYETRTLSGVDGAWTTLDPNGAFLDGSGVLLADLDTGIDLRHPDFWHGDGGVYSWIDQDQSGDLNPGDAVDVNHNGIADPGETLAWWIAPGNAPGLDSSFQLQIDHLYQDLNGNGMRDFGAPAFSDSDPCFGEPLFRANDENADGILQVGETLTMLSTCKVKAVWERDDTVRTLGVDLIQNEGDTFGHGTNVGSILLGGTKGRVYAGFAPGADLINANLDYFPEHPFVTPLDVRMAWAAAQGADIFVYEDGEWIWEFLDGSSNVEVLLNELAAEGSIHVAAAGNLAAGNMHWEGELGDAIGDSVETFLGVSSPTGTDVGVVWGDFYYLDPSSDAIEFSCQAPSGPPVSLGGTGSTTNSGNFSIYTAEDLSPRGTRRVDFRLEAIVKGSAGTRALDGTWRFVARRVSAAASTSVDGQTGKRELVQTTRLNAMSWDNLSGWFGRATWQNPVITGTVTWPGTADSAITVAAYSPQNGDINSFSGRGKRVDGVSLVDLAAPGSTTFTGQRYQSSGGVAGGYGSFGGTSAATPHVAGAAALLKQWDPSLGSGEMRALLRGGATLDAFTGPAPNDTWGAGKLNVYGSILSLATSTPAATPAARREPVVRANVPNPFNPSTLIRYELPVAGQVQVDILDLKGRRIVVLHEGLQTAGSQELRWDGRDASGRQVASGIYLVRVREDGREAGRKVTLLK